MAYQKVNADQRAPGHSQYLDNDDLQATALDLEWDMEKELEEPGCCFAYRVVVTILNSCPMAFGFNSVDDGSGWRDLSNRGMMHDSCFTRPCLVAE